MFAPRSSLGFRLTKTEGTFYILSQYAGAFFGALLAWFLTKSGGNLTVFEGKQYVFQALVLEMIGSFLMCTVYLIIQDQNYLMAKQQALQEEERASKRNPSD